MKTLSIIVPSYNTSRFIKHFFESILDSRYNDDIQIVIVNDGSKDDTLSIAHNYEKENPNTVLVVDKENGGHGSAINAGVKKCVGRYFKVVDGDDFVDSEALYHFICELKNIDADMVINPYTTISEITNESKAVDINTSPLCKNKPKKPFESKVYSADEILPYIYASIHSLTFKTSIFIENNITLTEKIFYEDNEYNLFALPYIETIFYSKYNVYRYLIDQSNQSISLTNTQKRVSHLEKVVLSLISFYNKYKYLLSKQKQDYIEKIVLSQIQSVFRIYLSFKEDLSAHKKEVKNFDYNVKKISKRFYRKSFRFKNVFATRFCFYAFYKPAARFLGK